MVDIDVGKISESLNDKADRDLNNTQPLARTVVETFVDGTSGYRIWSDWYCEQWGLIYKPANTNVNVRFVKTFSNTDYSVLATCNHEGTAATAPSHGAKTNSGFTIYQNNNANTKHLGELVVI